jgi:hypothetical protein
MNFRLDVPQRDRRDRDNIPVHDAFGSVWSLAIMVMVLPLLRPRIDHGSAS